MISIHALRVEGDTKALQGIHAKKPAISIHALRVEGDADLGTTVQLSL